jgi:hypothetical protein
LSQPVSRGLTAVVLGSVIALSMVTPGLAKTRGTLQVSPHKVKNGSKVTLLGKHLLPSTFYFLVLSVGSYNNPRARTLMSKTPKTNGHGAFTLHFKMPVMSLCGKSDIAAFHSVKSGVVHASVTLTGCARPKKITSPPPPPKKPKK